MNRCLSYKDISFIANYIYDFKEDFNSKTCFVISGNIKQFEIILNNFLNNKMCKTLFCIINNNFHWTLLTILKKDIFEIFYLDSFGNNLNIEYIKIIKKKLKDIFYCFNIKKIQEDNYSCGYYCIFFLLCFDILLNTQKKYSVLFLRSFVKYFFSKDKIFFFINKYKKILNKN